MGRKSPPPREKKKPKKKDKKKKGLPEPLSAPGRPTETK